MRVKHLSNRPHLLLVYWRNNSRGRTPEKVLHYKKAKDLQPVQVFFQIMQDEYVRIV